MKILLLLALLAGCVPLPQGVPGIHPAGPTGKPQRPLIVRVGQEYGEPIPSPPLEPNEECHIQCGRQHCEDWLKCGRAYEGSKLLRDRCRGRVRDRHEACHKKCSPGIG